MSRKDYRAIAAAIAFWRGTYASDANVNAAFEHLAKELCRVFERDNERFNERRFLAACQPEDD